MKWKIYVCALLLWSSSGKAQISVAQRLEGLPVEAAENVGEKQDWLLQPQEYRAGVYRSSDGKELILSNGLIRRVFRLTPNAATVGLDNLYSGEAFLRAVRP